MSAHDLAVAIAGPPSTPSVELQSRLRARDGAGRALLSGAAAVVIYQELEIYFRSRQVVCPYARTIDIQYFAEDTLDVEFSDWNRVVVAKRVAVIYAIGSPCDFEQARHWCDQTIVRTYTWAGRRQCRPDTPFVDIRDDSVAYVIGMGPQYPKQHPRYAPRLCLVAVNEASIREVSNEMRGSIWRAVLQRVGVAYDPDQVWLPVTS